MRVDDDAAIYEMTDVLLCGNTLNPERAKEKWKKDTHIRND